MKRFFTLFLIAIAAICTLDLSAGVVDDLKARFPGALVYKNSGHIRIIINQGKPKQLTGISDSRGNVLLAPDRYKNAYFYTQNGRTYISVDMSDNENGLCSEYGRELVPLKFTMVLADANIIKVGNEKSKGAYDWNGNEIVPINTYDYVHYKEKSNVLEVKTAEGATGIIDMKGNVVIPCRFVSIYESDKKIWEVRETESSSYIPYTQWLTENKLTAAEASKLPIHPTPAIVLATAAEKEAAEKDAARAKTLAEAKAAAEAKVAEAKAAAVRAAEQSKIAAAQAAAPVASTATTPPKVVVASQAESATTVVQAPTKSYLNPPKPISRPLTREEQMALAGHRDSPYYAKVVEAYNARNETAYLIALDMAIADGDTRAMVAKGDALYNRSEGIKQNIQMMAMINPQGVVAATNQIFADIIEMYRCWTLAAMNGNDLGMQRMTIYGQQMRIQAQYLKMQDECRQKQYQIDNDLYNKQMSEREHDRNFQNSIHEGQMAHKYKTSADEAYQEHVRAVDRGDRSAADEAYSRYSRQMETAYGYSSQQKQSEQNAQR